MERMDCSSCREHRHFKDTMIKRNDGIWECTICGHTYTPRWLREQQAEKQRAWIREHYPDPIHDDGSLIPFDPKEQ